MHTRNRAAAISALALLAFLGSTVPAQAKGCNISGDERKLGATYVTEVRVNGVSCGDGKALAKRYHSCRKSNGGADGRCSSFSGWKCAERRTSIKTQFDAKAECKKGSKVFSQKYTQNT